MAGDPISDYLGARNRFEAVTRTVTQMVGTIQNAEGMLHDWRHVVVAGVGGFSKEMLHAPDVPPWATAQELRAALQEYHKVKLDMDNAWTKVPAEKRAGLKSPTE